MLTISFGGGAWFVMFHLGVAKYVSEHIKPHLKENLYFCGCSAGSAAATALALDIDINNLSNDLILARTNNIFYMCSNAHNVSKKHIPTNDFVCQSASGKLLIGISTYKPLLYFQKAYKSSFSNRDDIIKALKATCHIPLLDGILPIFIDNKLCYDANITYNWSCLPSFNKPNERVIYVTSKYCDFLSHEGWISPQVKFPFIWQLFPPSEEILNAIMRLGYLRAWEYFQTFPSEYFYKFETCFSIELDNTLSIIKRAS